MKPPDRLAHVGRRVCWLLSLMYSILVCLFVSLMETACRNVLVKTCIKILWQNHIFFMTHLNFSVEQHGGIYISLSGNVSNDSSSSNIEKIQKRLKCIHNTRTYICYTYPENKWRASALVQRCRQPAFSHNTGH